MSDKTGIEWTDATWNPTRGCTPVSAGCKNCYASAVAKRFSGPGQPYEGLVRINAAGERTDDWNGEIKLVEEHLLDPLKWKKPRRIFVDSMSDLFHEGVPDSWIAKVVAVMIRAFQHTYQILTKRPDRMKELLSSEVFWLTVDEAIHLGEGTQFVGDFMYEPPCHHMHWGVSCEDQATADERIPLLLQTPAAVRFISAEPLLGPIVMRDYVWLPQAVRSDLPFPPYLVALPGIHEAHRNPLRAVSVTVDGRLLGIKPAEFEERELDWVICGGESGPGARPMHPDFARSLRDQCARAGVPFFFKQWGEWTPTDDHMGAKRNDWREFGPPTAPQPMRRVGKKAAGSLLDGVEWKQFPREREPVGEAR